MTTTPVRTRTLVDLLHDRARHAGEAVAFRFLEDESGPDSVSYAGLDRSARIVAAALRERGARPGDRVLLLYPPGLDYIRAFFGALYAGAVPVPVYPPRTLRNTSRLAAVAADSQAGFVLTTEPVLGLLATEGAALGLAGVRALATDRLAVQDPQSAADDWDVRPPSPEAPAFLQYTSGSTGSPKGVVLTHGNLVHNLGLISESFQCHEDSSGVIWLPPYHDMGLIGGILAPLYGGFPVTLMSPMSFLRRPLHWLRTISAERAELSGGPDFAYAMCVRAVTEQDKQELDLSSWRVAFNGAEPIRAATLDAFAEAFADCGFRRSAFLPCYGMAEATLFVTGTPAAAEPAVLEVDAAELEAGRAGAARPGHPSRRLVGSGRAGLDQQVLLVDPQTARPLPDRQVGEIWVRGASVAAGYWDNPETTEQTFGARLADEAADAVEGPGWLRTGDLGFLADGELYVTGRRKDLIIVRGRNFYPTDIEQAVERSHPAFRPGCAAAVAVDRDGESVLVVLQEVEGRSLRTLDVPEAVAAVRAAVMEDCDLAVHEVVLIKPGGIPKTTSGKIQRGLSRERYLAGGFEPIAGAAPEAAREAAQDPAEALPERAALAAMPLPELRALVARRLRTQLAAALGGTPAEVPGDVPLRSLGVDSLAAVRLTNLLREELGVDLPLSRVLDGADLDTLAAEAERAGEVQPQPLLSSEPEPPSYGQLSIWHAQQQDPQGTAFHIPVGLRLTGELDPQALERALGRLAERHAVLTDAYRQVGGELRVHPGTQPPALERISADGADEDRVAGILATLVARPFDLEHGPALRAHLLTLGEREHILLLTVHHIAADLWSMVVLAEELGRCYLAEAAGTTPELPEPAARYRDYAAGQRRELAGPRGAESARYWREALAGPLPVLELPDVAGSAPQANGGTADGGQADGGNRREFRLDAQQTTRLREFAEQSGVTLYTLLLAAFQIALHHASGQDQVVVGSPAANREYRAYEGVVGYFTNPLAVRGSFEPGLTAAEFITRLHRTVLGALDHQGYPLPLVLEAVQPPRAAGRSPLFQAVFALQKPHDHAEVAGFVLGADPSAEAHWGALQLRPQQLPPIQAQFELALTVVEAGAELYAVLEHHPAALSEAGARRLAQQVRTLLEELVEQPGATVDQLCPADLRDRRAPAAVTASGTASGAEDEDEGDGYVPPRTETERALTKIWSELLEVEPVGIEDDFYDLGGHSLLAVRLISAVRDRLGVDVPIRSVLQTRTVREAAAVVDALAWVRAARPAEPNAPASAAQEHDRADFARAEHDREEGEL